MTFDELVAMGIQMPGVQEGMSYGTPALKRKGRFMLRLKESGEDVAVKLDWATRDRLLAEQPGVFYLTPHYEGYPALLARLSELTLASAKELLDASWADAPFAAKTGP